MVTVASTATTMTYLQGEQLSATYNTSATHTTYQDTGLELSNVPQGSKIYYHLYYNDNSSTHIDIRVTDGTNTWDEQLTLTGSDVVQSLDGSITKSSGGTGTVKVQIRSGDANQTSLLVNTSGRSWIACTDASNPIVISGGGQNMIFSGKRQIGTLKAFYSQHDSTSTINSVSISGVVADQTSGSPVHNTIDLDVLTSQLNIDFSSAPTWTDTFGQAIVLIGFNGFNLEVTG